jgi:RHS repeat-associated protein
VPGFLTQYTYDPLGNLLSVAQNTQPGAAGGQQNRTYRYDGLSRLTSESNPEQSSATTYTYDTDATCGTSRGDLVKRVDSNGNTICNTYDGLHRSTSTTFSGPNATANRYFVYDTSAVDGQTMTNAKGRLAEAYTATSSSGTKITDEGFSYTARGELSKFLELTPHSAGFYSVPLTNWANGQTETVGPFLNWAAVSITPDGEGRPLTISSGAQNITYNPASQPTQLQVSCGSGICYPITYTYDPNTLRVTQYSFAGSNGTLSGTLTWNQNGSLGQLVVADPVNSTDAQTCNYSADSLARLASVSCNNGTTWGQQFSYDAFGNITKTVPSGATGVSWIPGYSSSTNHYSLGGTSYDGDGNLLNDTFNRYTWDAEGKQLSTAYSGGETWSYIYDAFGHMVELSVNGAYTYSYVTLGKFRFSATGQTADYSETPLPGGSIASQGNGDTGIQIGDWLGTVRGNSNYTGGVVNSTGARAPFGEPYAYAGAAPEAFTGQDGDGQRSSPIYWFPERQYVSTQSRWISPDPAGLAAADPGNPQSWNRYAYVYNNPMAATDPSGMDTEDGDPCGAATGIPGQGGCDTSGDFPSFANDQSGNPFSGPSKWQCFFNPQCWLSGLGGEGTGEASDPFLADSFLACGIYGLCGGGGAPPSAPANTAIISASKTSWYKNPCIQKALAKGALSAGIDAIGLIPGGGAVSAELSLFRGAAAVSNGTAILGRVQLGAGIITTANGASNTSQLGVAQTALGVGGIVAGVAKAAPVVGQVLSGLAVVGDFVGTGMEIAQCQ